MPVSHFPGKFEFLVKSMMATILAAILDDATDPQQPYPTPYNP